MKKFAIAIAVVWAIGQFGIPALQSWDIAGSSTSINRATAAQLVELDR